MMKDSKNNLNEFFFDGVKVRVCGSPASPLFVAKDVCDVLCIKNSRDAVATLDDDEKGVGNADTLGGVQQLQVVTESGLYHLIFKSRKAEAKKFRRWVTDEVLPALRKRGFYEVVSSRELITLPLWLEHQGVDLSRNKRDAKRLLKKAWEASKLLGYREKRTDEESGLVIFPHDVLSLAADESGEVIELECDDYGVANVLLGLEPGRVYTPLEIGSLLGFSGCDKSIFTKVGKALKPYIGRVCGEGIFKKLPNKRAARFMVDVPELDDVIDG